MSLTVGPTRCLLLLAALATACGNDAATDRPDAWQFTDSEPQPDVDPTLPDAFPGQADAPSAAVPITLLAIGDQGEGNAGQYCVAEAMNAICANGSCDGILLTGDNFYDNGVSSVDDVQWRDKFEMPYKLANLDLLPFYVVLGNHDYGATSFGDKQSQIAYTTLPVGNGVGQRYTDKWNMPASYYDVNFGGIVQVFALDTQDLSATQKDDMRARVTTSTAAWKLVFAHHPRFTSGNHQFDNDLLGFFSGMFTFQEASTATPTCT